MASDDSFRTGWPSIDQTPIAEIIAGLATAQEPPPAPLVACLARMNEAAPPLRAIVEHAADRQPLDETEQILLFRGLHVLGAGRDVATFRPLLRLLRLPSDELEFYFGDAITETMPRILAGVFDGDADFADESLPAMTPAFNPWRHVGRNDPCPCGSGTKAKRCCLAR